MSGKKILNNSPKRRARLARRKAEAREYEQAISRKAEAREARTREKLKIQKELHAFCKKYASSKCKLSLGEIERRRKEIVDQINMILGGVKLDKYNFEDRISNSLLEYIIRLIDEYFFNNEMFKMFEKNKCCFSICIENICFMPDVGGYCELESKNIKIVINKRTMIRTLDQMERSRKRGKLSGGLTCEDIITCLLFVIEHELVHAVVGCDCMESGYSNEDKLTFSKFEGRTDPVTGHSKTFMGILYNRFGHVVFTHRLETPRVDELIDILDSDKLMKDEKFRIVSNSIDEGFDVEEEDSYGNTILIEASGMGLKEIVLLLLSNGADVNRRGAGGKTPIFSAIEGEKTDLVKILLDKGANPNITDEEGDTPLMFSVYKQHKETFKLLSKLTSDINLKNREGESALYLAVERQNTYFVKTLLEMGAEINTENLERKTPVYLAIELENIVIVKILLEKGANVNSETTDGITPLILASEIGNLDLVKLLIKKGAEISFTDDYGKKAIDYARDYDRMNVVSYLESLD